MPLKTREAPDYISQMLSKYDTFAKSTPHMKVVPLCAPTTHPPSIWVALVPRSLVSASAQIRVPVNELVLQPVPLVKYTQGTLNVGGVRAAHTQADQHITTVL